MGHCVLLEELFQGEAGFVSVIHQGRKLAKMLCHFSTDTQEKGFCLDLWMLRLAPWQSALTDPATAETLIVIGFQSEVVSAIDPTQFVTDEIFMTGSSYVNHAELAEAATWVEPGRVIPVISRTYPLAEAESALVDLAANRIVGRALLFPTS